MRKVTFLLLIILLNLVTFIAYSQKKATKSVVTNSKPDILKATCFTEAEAIKEKVISWRREIHQNPELGNREFNTADKIAKHLTALGIEVKTKVAYTGVVGVLKGALPGPVVALRADMDALPVAERVNLPFASKVTTEYNQKKVGVMHACGHDTHVAILMGVAEILAKHKSELKGSIKFIFQPAEEGAPEGEEGGALLMVKEGVLENPKVDVAFGLHINAQTPIGQIKYKTEGIMAATDFFTIKIKGKQAHGAYPHHGIDPIVVGSEMVNTLQTIISRNLNLVNPGAVLTVGVFDAGNRFNIIPEEAKLSGTIRSLDEKVRETVHKRIREIAEHTAAAHGASATVDIQTYCPVTYNHVALSNQMVSSLNSAAGAENVVVCKPTFGGEDFAYFQEKVPGFFYMIGGAPLNVDAEKQPSHHTPDFYIDDSGLGIGVKSLIALSLDYMEAGKILK
jgi:amidohydrolase